jgi:von Willebrand factor type A domain
VQHDFILLDRSGSMETRWQEAVNSVNSYVAKLAEDKVDTGVTLVAFDNGTDGRLDFNIVRDRIIPSTWRKVTHTEVSPRNGTPLNDATARIVSLAEAGGYERLALIIMTDGLENASKEYPGYVGTHAIRAMLDRCRAKNWQVIFLGANFDNAHQASSYGNLQAATMSMDSGQMVNSTRATASKRAVYGATGQSISFTDEEKAELNKKKD